MVLLLNVIMVLIQPGSKKNTIGADHMVSDSIRIRCYQSINQSMSCHVIVRTAYPFPWGCGVLLLEPIPAMSQGEGKVLPG